LLLTTLSALTTRLSLFPYTTLFRSAHWIDNDLKYFLAFFAARNRTDFDLYAPGIIISLNEPRHLLAMKLRLCFETPQPADVEDRSEEHTSELQSRENLVCRLLLETK